MTVLDRYIARNYFFNAVTLLVILFCFVIAVDVSLNLDRYSRAAERLLEHSGVDDPGAWSKLQTTSWIIIDLWWPRLLMLYNFLLGLVLVAAMGFTCSQMVRHRELVAVLASGQSLHRLWKPILLVAALFVASQALNQELVLPRIAPLLMRDQGDAGRVSLGKVHLPMTVDGDNRLWYARVFDADAETLEDVVVYERTDGGLPIRTIRAPLARWSSGAWRLTNPTSERVDLTPDPAPQHIETSLSPTELKRQRFASFRRNLSWVQIGQMIDRNQRQAEARRDGGDQRSADRLARQSAELERIRWGRISVMASNMLVLVIALPFYLTRAPTNMLVQSLKCAPVSIGARVR
jgi:lipopolysaccharide export LptBFGC system permease protein LptF